MNGVIWYGVIWYGMYPTPAEASVVTDHFEHKK